MSEQQSSPDENEIDASGAPHSGIPRYSHGSERAPELRLEWRVGAPTKPWSEEWFIAETIWGDRVVLRALPEEWTYDFKTADDTYIKHDKIKRWMQFPDSEFIAPAVIRGVAQRSLGRDTLAATIHKARWPADRQLAVTPFEDEDRNGREYCYRIADAALSAVPPSLAQASGKPVAWLYEMAHYIKPSDENPFRDWKRVVTTDPPPTIPKDGVRNVVPLYAVAPSPLADRGGAMTREIHPAFEPGAMVIDCEDFHQERAMTDTRSYLGDAACDFDAMCDLFTSYARTVANWQQYYYGAAYSTRLKSAIADMKFAIAEAEKHPEIGGIAQAPIAGGWTPEQFWEYVGGLAGEFDAGQMRDMMVDKGLSIAPRGPGERADRLEDERNRLQNSYGGGPFADGLITRRIAEIDKELSSTMRDTAMEEMANRWPLGCHSPNSCHRNKRCMYVGCRHDGTDAMTSTQREGGK